VRYPWHPWCGRCVFIDASIERNGRLFFYCHVEETLGKSAVEIPAWMFDSLWEQIRLRDLSDTPAVGCEALKNLKLLLATASSGGHPLQEAQRLEGGADAKTAKSTTISAGIVSTANPDTDLAHMAPEVKEQTMRLLSRLLRHYWKRRKGSIPAEAGNE